MANALNIATRFYAVDGFTAPVSRMTRATDTFAAKASNAMARVERASRGLNKSLGDTGAQLKTVAAVAIGAGMYKGAEAVLGFDKSLTAAGAKFGVFNMNATEAKSTMDALGAAAKNVGGTTQFSAGNAAQGLDLLATAGLSVADSIAALPNIANLATIANTDLATATEMGLDAVGAFKKTSADLPDVMDMMAKTSTSAKLTMTQLYETIKEGASVATTAGADMATFNALVGRMAEAGIKGSKAGTAIKGIFTRLTALPAEAAKALGKLGVKTLDAQKNLRDMPLILGDIAKATKGMGTGEKTAILSKIFGLEAFAAGSTLVAQGADVLVDYREKVKDSKDVAEKMANFMNGGLSGAWMSALSASESVAVSLGETFRPEIDAAIDSMTAAARDTNTWVTQNKSLIKTLFTVAKWAGIGVVAVKAFGVALSIVRAGIVAYNFYLGVSAAVTGTYTGALGVSKAAQIGFAIATKIATAAQWLFAAAVNAGIWPITLVVAVIAGVILAVKNWDKITVWFSDKWQKFTTFISAAWTGVVQWFKDFDFGAFFRSIGQSIINFLLAPIKTVLSLASTIPGKIGESAAAALVSINDLTNIETNANVSTTGDAATVANVEAANATGNVQRIEKTQNTKAELLIRDETGKASLTGDLGMPVNLSSTGSW